MVPAAQTFSPAAGVKFGYRALPSTPDPSLPTLLLIHPFITDGSFFAHQFEDPELGGQAGKKWNMITIDIHGHGDSTGRQEFTYWDTASDAALLLDHLGIKKVTVVGTSQGGFVATRLAIHRPDLVENIIYTGSTLLPETKESHAGITFLTTKFPYVEENFGVILQSGFGFDHTAADATEKQKAAGEKWSNVWRTRYGGSPEKEARTAGCVKQLLGRDDIVPRVNELKTKIHIMHGESDAIYSVAEHAEGSKKVLEEHDLLASYQIVPGGAHYLSFEKWQEVNPRLIQIMTEA